MGDYYENLVNTYPILTLEDPFAEDAFEDSAKITAKLGKKVRIIGDDLYVTNPDQNCKRHPDESNQRDLDQTEPDRNSIGDTRSNSIWQRALNSQLQCRTDQERLRILSSLILRRR